MTEALIIVKIIVAFAWGLLIGLNWNARKRASEAMDNFVENQHLRDENAILKRQVEQLQKNLNEHGII